LAAVRCDARRYASPCINAAFSGLRRVARPRVAPEERGYITGISAYLSASSAATANGPEADPNGVRLGDTSDSVTARHLEAHSGVDDRGQATLVGHVSTSVGFGYTFAGGRVAYIQWGTNATGSLPELAALALPAGDSPATAILVVAKNESDGVSWEYRFLGFHPCDGDTGWKLSQQSLRHDGTRSYDVLPVTCPTTKAERDFYFDITSYFGKL